MFAIGEAIRAPGECGARERHGKCVLDDVTWLQGGPLRRVFRPMPASMRGPTAVDWQQRDAGVDDQNVDAAEFGVGALDHVRDFVGLGDIGTAVKHTDVVLVPEVIDDL